MTPHITVTPIHVTVVKGSSFTDTRNHVKNPVTAMASTFENIHPLSSNPAKSLPVNGMAAIPSSSASSHQVMKTHTSPSRNLKAAPTSSNVPKISGSHFLIFLFIKTQIPLLYNTAQFPEIFYRIFSDA